jgi:hypothetical protein
LSSDVIPKNATKTSTRRRSHLPDSLRCIYRVHQSQTWAFRTLFDSLFPADCVTVGSLTQCVDDRRSKILASSWQTAESVYDVQ